MEDLKNILANLAGYYGGEYTEKWGTENIPPLEGTTFKVEIRTPRTVFNHTSLMERGEERASLQERVRHELLWGILQKGVEFVNEQSDIFHMFALAAQGFFIGQYLTSQGRGRLFSIITTYEIF